VRHPIDIATMFAALWLLGSMVLDYLTPKELTVYMIAAATAPAVIGTALCYYLKFPKIDFLLILATLWLVAALTIEWLSPVPLPFPDWCGSSAGVDRRRNLALASLPLARASTRMTACLRFATLALTPRAAHPRRRRAFVCASRR
jgi:hypothetical protein